MSYKSKQNEQSKQRYIEARKNLIALSKIAREMVKIEEVDSVNEGLIMMYDQEQGKECEYNTFHQWKEKGCTILKGVHAYAVWGQPRKATQTPEGEQEPEEYKYWPLCYLFSDLQVVKPEPMKEQPQQRAEVKQQNEALQLEEVF